MKNIVLLVLGFLALLVLSFLSFGLVVWVIMYALSFIGVQWASYQEAPWLVVFVLWCIFIIIRNFLFPSEK